MILMTVSHRKCNMGKDYGLTNIHRKRYLAIIYYFWGFSGGIIVQARCQSNISGDTVTELLTVRSDKELEQMIAYSRAQIDVSQSFVLSLHIATYQKGPQAVENPGQNLSYGAAAVFNPLKLVNQCTNSISIFPPLVVLIELSQIPNVLASIVIVQLTQHVQTQQQVADPRAPGGALVSLVPLENNVFTGFSKNSYYDRVNDYGSIVSVRITSLRAEYEETQSECDAFDNLARQSYAPKLILLNEITFKLLQMGFWSGLRNIGSKILHGVTFATKWVAPVLHKVMGAVSGPIGAINPTAVMIARGVGGAAGMANKFLNR
ncbi:MAG: hypothetical protein EZS28_007547 [Streblomastix strix]|uniref:Uncharacterized protein n=1 Tax=Streblomastix strix TaxID=222440 RepID=A0A5J4WQU6_9EUKA|nr:MAG: hypothetical protein EZS28_007547 [Streblomastix strix]